MLNEKAETNLKIKVYCVEAEGVERFMEYRWHHSTEVVFGLHC